MIEMSRLDVMEMFTGCRFKVPAVLIDAQRRQVRAIEIIRSEEEIAPLLLKGERKLKMSDYRCMQLGYGDVMFYLMATAYWCGCLQPGHRCFFKIEGVSEPHVWRALIVGGGDTTFDLSTYQRKVQFIDELEARELTDKALEEVESIAGALSGRAIQRWRPWELSSSRKPLNV
jgi:hypothetical protein